MDNKDNKNTIRRLLLALLATVLGAILLRLFIPWWMVAILMGGIAALIIYDWVGTATKIPERWRKRILTIVIVIFSISLVMSFVEKKWPWVAKALDSRQMYSSFIASDAVHPDYPDTLAMSVYQTERMKIQTEEIKLKKELEEIQKKLAKGGEFTTQDQAKLENAKTRLAALDKELQTSKLSRQDKATWWPDFDKSCGPWAKGFIYLAIAGLGILLFKWLLNLFKIEAAPLGKMAMLLLVIGLAGAIICGAFPIIPRSIEAWASTPSSSTAPGPVASAIPSLPGISTGKTVEPGQIMAMDVRPGKTPPPKYYAVEPSGKWFYYSWTGMPFRNNDTMSIELRVEYPPGTDVNQYLDIHPWTGNCQTTQAVPRTEISCLEN